jgi:VWFA-related protein
MRIAALVLIMIASALPAFATQTLTVAQLEQMLARQRSERKSDSSTAHDLTEVTLTEELTGPTLKRITADAGPGPQTTQALELLADESALLAPPEAEIPTDPKPDMNAQRAMLTGAINYVVTTLRHLPDFLAVRETRSFDDSPLLISHTGYAPIAPMHLVGTFQRDITYRDGKEVNQAEKAAAKHKNEEGPTGLTTWGEFGPVLTTVLADAVKGRITWSRWEQTPAGRAAVYHYSVPSAISHYHVDYCCAWQQLSLQLEGRPTEDQPTLSYHGTPGYHGDLYIDPSTGVILRLTLEAELDASAIIRRAAMSVQYGSVEIGGTNYNCPLNGIAISQVMDRVGTVVGGAPPQTRVNETTFIGYHRFGTTMRILAGAPGDQPAAGTPPQANPSASATAANAPAGSAESPAAPAENPSPAAENPPSTAENPPQAASAANPPAEPGPATTSAADVRSSSAPADQANSQAATAPASPASQTGGQPPAESNAAAAVPVFKTTARAVLLDVVVTKNEGDPVHGLAKQDFAISENGQAQNIDYFQEHEPNDQAAGAAPEMPDLPSGAVTNVPPAPTGDAVNVLLLDSLNTPPQDQANLQKQILSFASKMKPGTRVAVFTLDDKLRFVQGFTSDSSVLLAALKKNGMAGEKNGRTRSDAADDAADIEKMRTMRQSAAGIAAMQAAQSNARGADLGDHAAMTLEALSFLAHYLSGVPGRKNLLWFSSSFPVAIFPSAEQSKNIEKMPALRDSMQRIKQTADLFTASQISIYPIAAEGLTTEHVMEADMAGPAAPEGSGHAGGGAIQAFNAETGGREQLVNAMQQLAASTGGKAFYNANDLNVAMQKAIDDGAYYYTLGYSPTNKTMDGSFRHIDVKVTHGKYKLAYQNGYNAEETPASDSSTQESPLADLLDYGMPSATGILYGVDCQPGPTQEASDDNRAGLNQKLQGTVTRYRVDLTVRAEDVELVWDGQGGRTARLLIGVKAYDKDGHAVNWEAADNMLKMKESEYGALIKNGIPMHLLIDLPANQEAHLVTAIYDVNSGRAGSVETELGGDTAK